MTGLSVKFNEFEIERVVTPGFTRVKNNNGTEADQMLINYLYPIEGEDDIEARLVIEMPSLRTATGIQPAKKYGDETDSGPGKPAIQVTLKRDSNPAHRLFAGTLGNKHEYTEDDDGRKVRVHEDFTEPSGVLGQLYDWSITQYATHLGKTSKKPHDVPTLSDFEKASDPKTGIQRKNFYYERTDDDGNYIPDANPVKFFKIMCFKPGTPAERMAKFILCNETEINPKDLYNQGFEFDGFLGFRRLYSGEKPTVQMEIIEAVVTDLFEVKSQLPLRCSRLIQQKYKGDDERIAATVAKYNDLYKKKEDKFDSSKEISSGCKVDIDDHEDDLKEDKNPEFPLKTDEEETTVSRRPKFPSKAIREKATE